MAKFKVHSILLLINLIYGANYTIAKEVMPDHILPFGFILIRVVSACVLFILVHFLFVKEKVRAKDLFRLFLCGVFGVAINQLMFFKGLNLTSPINASLMMITTPILVMLISSLMSVESLTATKILGILLGAFGAFLVIFWGKKFSFSEDSVLGDFLVLINAASYAIYLVLVKSLTSKYHPITITKWVFIFGMMIVIPVGFNEVKLIHWQEFSATIWFCILYVILCTTFFAYLLNVSVLRKVNPSLVGIYIYLQPVIASAIALIFLKDQLSLMKVMAALLIFSGVYLVSMNRTKLSS